jgi:hypothetical protein
LLSYSTGDPVIYVKYKFDAEKQIEYTNALGSNIFLPSNGVEDDEAPFSFIVMLYDQRIIDCKTSNMHNNIVVPLKQQFAALDKNKPKQKYSFSKLRS